MYRSVSGEVVRITNSLGSDKAREEDGRDRYGMALYALEARTCSRPGRSVEVVVCAS